MLFLHPPPPPRVPARLFTLTFGRRASFGFEDPFGRQVVMHCVLSVSVGNLEAVKPQLVILGLGLASLAENVLLIFEGALQRGGGGAASRPTTSNI